jgi:carbonic anhydrase
MNDATATGARNDETSGPQRPNLPNRLIEGYKVFLGGRFRREQDRYERLGTMGQKPKVLLIGCCDSRVSPEVIFDADPGEIFVVRNVANLVPPYAPNDDLHGTSAALEFAVMSLKVEHIVVMGHASCGGVRAFVEGLTDPQQKPLSPGDFIGKWMSLIGPAAEKLGPPTQPFADYVERLGRASIIETLVNLRSFPWVQTAERRGDLQLYGAYFGVADGVLLALDEAGGEYLPVAAESYAEAFTNARLE